MGLLLAACSTPSTEEAAQDLCSSLGALEARLQQVAVLGPDSSVEEAQAAREAVADAWSDVTDDAEVVNAAAADEAAAALDQFNDALSDISGDARLDEAAEQVLSAQLDFSAALAEIESSITCD